MLKIDRISSRYAQVQVLNDVSLEVKDGEVLGLLGRNGAGKSTLLKSIMGLVEVNSGSISLDGTILSEQQAHQIPKNGIGYVPQGREIFTQLSVEENLQVALLAREDGLNEIPELIFEAFPVLKQMLNRRGGDLSGGQQQQLAIGRALSISPKLLILDEPTEGIQPNIVHEIGDIIIRLNQEGLTILLVEQKLPFARRVAQNFCILDKGRDVATDAMENLGEDVINRYLKV